MMYDKTGQQPYIGNWLNSDENKKQISLFETCCEEYVALWKQYKNSFEELQNAAENCVARREYAKGGEKIHRGAYFPGMKDFIVGGMNRGRLLKKAPKDNRYNYEYLFNSDNQMICVKKYLLNSRSDYCLAEIEFLIHKENEVLSLMFDQWNETWLIHGISKCKYKNQLLLRYEKALFGVKENESVKINTEIHRTIQELLDLSYFEFECDRLDVEEYQYTEDLVASFHWYDYVSSLKTLTDYFAAFQHDEDGCLSSYTLKEKLIDGSKNCLTKEKDCGIFYVSEKGSR